MSTVFDGLVLNYVISRPAVPESTDLGETVPAQPAVSFRASLAVVTAGRARGLVEHYGADAQDTFLIGECLAPARLPAGVGPGFTVPFTWNGQAGTLTILEVIIDPFADLMDEIVGQAFFARFRA